MALAHEDDAGIAQVVEHDRHRDDGTVLDADSPGDGAGAEVKQAGEEEEKPDELPPEPTFVRDVRQTGC
ncbi:hypothetical protein GMSM_16740 [Geomonas sp. Red276]